MWNHLISHSCFVSLSLFVFLLFFSQLVFTDRSLLSSFSVSTSAFSCVPENLYLLTSLDFSPPAASFSPTFPFNISFPLSSDHETIFFQCDRTHDLTVESQKILIVESKREQVKNLPSLLIQPFDTLDSSVSSPLVSLLSTSDCPYVLIIQPTTSILTGSSLILCSSLSEAAGLAYNYTQILVHADYGRLLLVSPQWLLCSLFLS
jgi:hypothetical protein